MIIICRDDDIRPSKAALIQTLRTHPQARAIPIKQLQAIAAFIAKAKHMTAERISLKQAASQRIEAIEAPAHIRGPSEQMHPRGCAQCDHDATSHSVSGAAAESTCHKAATSRASKPRGTSKRPVFVAST